MLFFLKFKRIYFIEVLLFYYQFIGTLYNIRKFNHYKMF